MAAERPMGVFNRQPFLGDTLDTDKLEAVYENGVLMVRIPVADHAKPHRISVTTTDGRQQIKS